MISAAGPAGGQGVQSLQLVWMELALEQLVQLVGWLWQYRDSEGLSGGRMDLAPLNRANKEPITACAEFQSLLLFALALLAGLLARPAPSASATGMSNEVNSNT